ncbi:MAG: helix-turn-helix transcriptional regulator [Acidobacteria bacterium]|nr:helix-turn-helix transcriptional regulator [Acidobacteriota bacterium]
MSSPADIGLAILIFLQLREVSQEALASSAGINPKTITAWKGGRRPDPKLLGKVAKALNVSVAQINEVAALIAKLRANLKPQINIQLGPTRPQQDSSIAETSSLRFLSDDTLTLELGRTRERELEIEAEIKARKHSG